uniref:MFS transporter n=1 Tax=Thermosphaera aggregans TaxID=54254 RepID=A0A7C2FNK8_9CREN
MLISLLNLLDLLINIIAVRIIGMNIIEISLLNFAWTIVFVFFVKIANRLGDKGIARFQIILGLIGVLSSEIFLKMVLKNGQYWLIYASYVVHAVAYSFTRIGVNAFVLENFQSSEWGVVFKKISRNTLLIDAVLLITISRITTGLFLQGFEYFIVITLLAYLLGVFKVKEPVFKIERILNRIERNISRVITSIHGYLNLTSFENFNGTFIPSYRVLQPIVTPLKLIIIGLLGFRIGNEFLFTPLPYHFIKTLGFDLNQVFQIYGIGKIVAFTLYTLFQGVLTKKSVFLASIPLRIFTVYVILISGLDLPAVATSLGLLYLANSIIDSNLYLQYVESTGGYGTGTYSLVSEASSLIGVLTSGYVYSVYGLTVLLILVGFLSIPKIVLAVMKKDYGLY